MTTSVVLREILEAHGDERVGGNARSGSYDVRLRVCGYVVQLRLMLMQGMVRGYNGCGNPEF